MGVHIPEVKAFFDDDSNTISYVVSCAETRHAAIIDSVLGLDYASGGISYQLADDMLAYIAQKELVIDWLIETHVHADHLSAAPYLQEKIGGKIAISRHIVEVQKIFGKVFNAGTEFERDGSQFEFIIPKQWRAGYIALLPAMMGSLTSLPRCHGCPLPSNGGHHQPCIWAEGGCTIHNH